MKWFLFIMLASLLAGCASSISYEYEGEQERLLLAESLGEIELVPDFSLLGINDDIRQALDQRINQSWGAQRKLRELRDFLFGANERNVVYAATAIRTTVQVYEERTGNCLAMTTLFIAAARYIGLDAKFKVVDVEPSWDHQRGTMIRYEHIVATGRLPGGKYVVDFLPRFDIADGLGRWISDTKALALYYNNQGAEHFLAGDLPGAIVQFRHALSLNPEHSDTWNNMGAAMFRAGNIELAEFAYKRSLRQSGLNLSAISNLARLYKSQGRDADAALMKDRVRRYRQHNPYYYYFLANVSLAEAQYENAIPLLKRAIRIKKDDPDFHTALALSFAKTGDEEASNRELILAERYKQELPPGVRERDSRNLVIQIVRGTHLK